jgi:hypothetical protein
MLGGASRQSVRSLRQEISQRIQNADSGVVRRGDICSLRSRCADFAQREKPNPGNQKDHGPKDLWRQETTGSSGEIHRTNSPYG